MKITKKTGLLFIALVCIFILLVILLKGNKDTNNEIRIGAILPLTGWASFTGQTCKDGLDLAIKDINNEQSNYTFKVIYEDCKSSPKDALMAYKKLRSSGINFFVGFGGQFLLGYTQETQGQDVVLFAEGAANMNLLSLSDKCFRLFPNADMMTNKVVSFYREKNVTKAGVVCLQNDAYSLYADFFKQKFESDTTVISLFEGYDPNSRDFKDIVSKLVGKDIEYLYLAGAGESTALFLRQLYSNPKTSNIPVVGDMSLYISSNLDLIGEIKAPIYIMDSYITPDFTERYQKEYGTHPNAYGAYAYATPYILLDAFKALNGNLDPGLVYPYIKDNEFKTVVGPIQFDKDTREPVLILNVNTVK